MVNVTTVVLLVELFPARTRMSGGSIGFNVALAAIGGPGPLIAAAFASSIAFPGAGAFYMVAVALVSLFALARYLPETRGIDLGVARGDVARLRPHGALHAQARPRARQRGVGHDRRIQPAWAASRCRCSASPRPSASRCSSSCGTRSSRCGCSPPSDSWSAS